MDSATRRVRKRTLRSRITPFDVFASANSLTDRDRKILLDLYRHRVLTLHQLSELHFTHPRKARKRLLELYERGLVQRFRPWREQGSAPFHYVLGELGLHVVAGNFDLDLKRIKQRIAADQKLAHSAKLAHLLEVHDFFVALIACCRQTPGHRVARWWSERRCALEWADNGTPIVRPDAQGIVRGPGASCSFLLELDRGTERGERLTEKSRKYVLVARRNLYDLRRGEPPRVDVVLYLFPSARRELSARERIEAWMGLPVVTSHRALHERDPLGRNWSPVWRDSDARLNLYELPALNDGGSGDG